MSKSVYEFGIEQENLVMEKEGDFYTKEIYLENYYTKDFANNQVELVTPVFQDKKTFKDFYDEVVKRMKKKYYLWPISTMDEFDKNDVEIAVLDDANEMVYRRYLQKKYPLKKMLYSGIHYNFSFTSDYLAKEAKRLNVKNDREFRNGVYFKILKNFHYYGPLLLFFTSYSPQGDNIISERNSTLGYNNELKLKLNLSSLAEYNKSIQEAIDKKTIFSLKELYSKVRLKGSTRTCPCEQELIQDIRYIEFRAIDLNPLSKNGFDAKMVDFINSFFHFLYLAEEKEISYKQSIKNFDEAALKGYMGSFKLGDQSFNANDFARHVFKEMNRVLDLYDENENYDVLAKFYSDFIDKKIPAEVIRKRIKGLTNKTYGLKVMRAKSEKK